MQKMSKCFKKKYIVAIIYAVLLTAIWVFGPIRVTEKNVSTEKSESNQVMFDVYDSVECKQYFKLPNHIDLNAVEIQFATYNGSVTEKELYFSICTEDGELLYQTTINAAELSDNSYYRVTLDESISISKSSLYFVITGSDSQADGIVGPAVWCSNDKDNGTEEILYVNGEQQVYSINAVYDYSYTPYSLYMNYVWQLLLGFILILCLPTILPKFHSLSGFVKCFFIIYNIAVLEIMVNASGFSGVETTPLIRLATYAVLASFIFVFTGILGNAYLGTFVVDIIMVIFGIFNYFVMLYRGAPIVPSDIFSVKTLNTVVGTYVISFTYIQKIILIWLVLIVAYCIRLFIWDKCLVKISLKRKLVSRISAIVIGLAGLAVFSNATVLTNGFNIYPNIWSRQDGYYVNGPIMDFMINMQFVRIEKPKNYSRDLAKEYLEDYNDESKETEVLLEDLPNVILIMNEALADFDFYENNEVQLTEDPLPFIHSLEENTIKGSCYVSIFGSGTANSEMEALTGHTMAYFPSGSIVYQQYEQENAPGLASSLKNLGYTTIAMHPFTKSNWNRISVYNSMGFDAYLAEEAFTDAEYVRWVSDKSTYDKIIDLYEDKDQDDRLFIMDITMQGHGGYTNNTSWDNPIEVVGAELPLTKEYLSSTYVSDQAFQYLIEYFSKETEPTVILMFGDHQPAVEDEFFEMLLGKSLTGLTLEELQKRFCTPYVLWTNFDIESNLDYDISANQIASLIKSSVDIPLTAYDSFIQAFSEEIPIINANGFCDKNGTWYTLDQPGEYEELLYQYSVIQYAIYCDELIIE